MRARTAQLALACLLLACGGTEAPPPPRVGLPFDLARPEAGDPVSAEELTRVTDAYLDLLEAIRYFDFIDQRSIGWPASDPEGRYWYGSWWSGVNVVRTGQSVVFTHPDDGSDNNGLRTGPMLEGACYTLALAPSPAREQHVRKLVRGFSSWIMAMERTSTSTLPVMLTRAAYPRSVEYDEGVFHVRIDYDNNHPGLDSGASEYVFLPDNPHWGELWVKNKRSKDDLGHMIRALAQLEACAPILSAEGRRDLDEVLARYRAFAQQVEADGFRIATYDRTRQVWIPIESLAILVQEVNAECDAILTMRLLGHGDPGAWACGNGITDADQIISQINDHARHIFWSFHHAAAHLAIISGAHDVGRELLLGLGARNDETLDRLERRDPPGQYNANDFSGFMAHSANAGLPLTWREVRFLHQRLQEAHDAYVAEAAADSYRVLDPDGPDGTFPVEPPSYGFNFRELGVPLGTCVSPRRNPAGKPLLDCDRVRARF